MANDIYANAYKEVLIVINKLVKDDYKKIAPNYIEFLELNCNNQYEFEYDSSKSFEEQNLLEETKYILFGFFEKFGATEVQKTKIKDFKNKYNNELEEKKRAKYNPNDIFRKKDEKKDLYTSEETSGGKTSGVGGRAINFKFIDYIKFYYFKKNR